MPTPRPDEYDRRYGPDHARAIATLDRLQTYGTPEPGWRKRLLRLLLRVLKVGIGDDLD